MKPTEIADKLEAHNRWWRGGDDEPAPNPSELGRTLDAAVAALRKLTTAGQAYESYEGPVIDCRTCVHIGPMKDCTAPVACVGGTGFERRSALQLWRCTKCGGTMAPGVAMGQTVTGELDFPGDRRPVTLSPGGPGVLIDCIKSSACGRSVSR